MAAGVYRAVPVILFREFAVGGPVIHTGTIPEAVRRTGLNSRVVVITGAGDFGRLDRVRDLKPAAMLKKPVDFGEILEKLKVP